VVNIRKCYSHGSLTNHKVKRAFTIPESIFYLPCLAANVLPQYVCRYHTRSLTLFSTHRTLRTVLFTVKYKARNFKTVTFRDSVRDIQSLAVKRTTHDTTQLATHKHLYKTVHTYYASNAVTTSRTCISQLGKLLRQPTLTTPWNTQFMCTDTFSHVRAHTHTYIHKHSVYPPNQPPSNAAWQWLVPVL
jgi:hypothetical protein